MTEPAAIAAVGDETLVARAAAGDVGAFEALVATRLSRAFRTASAILGNEADANDVVQDAFISIWRHLPGLRDGARFDGWLNKTIMNRCRDVLRRRRRSREVAIGGVLDTQTEDSTDAVGDIAALRAAFELLTAEHRHLLVMHHLHRISVVDLAQQLGIPEGTAKWRLHAARAALERALETER
jgi:RNA polymerase sigma-70 factor (ECF subfamily)